ncbi:MAG TPA: MaoC/PaaZ C-terminal domain-containing protein [Longimicrobiaceae bacterium]|nr:MaoC/PaaZ C-terminal domain-containing protein [Longimicrobiaceae bacterium]
MSRLAALRSMLRLVARGLASRGDAQPLPEVPRRRPAVERDGIAVEPARVERYLRATAGGGIARLRGGDAVVSPVFPATWETAQALELFAGLEHPLPAGVVHVEGELVSLRPIAAADRIRCRVELERADPVRRGIRLVLVARNWNAAGQLCTQSTTAFLARSRAPPAEEADDAGAARSSSRAEGDPRAEPPEEWDEAASWRLRGDAGRRYAAVSGDYNPIHLWSFTARPFGFRRPILHGFCTQAMVAHALIMQRFDGDPTALRRLRIAFRAPLPLPSVARLLVGERMSQRWFRVVDERGETVFAEGTYAGGVQVPRPELRVVR